jgi:hypothetical protein
MSMSVRDSGVACSTSRCCWRFSAAHAWPAWIPQPVWPPAPIGEQVLGSPPATRPEAVTSRLLGRLVLQAIGFTKRDVLVFQRQG